MTSQKTYHAAKAVLETLGDLIKWFRLRFKAKQSGSGTNINGKEEEVRFTIAGRTIPTVQEEPVKSYAH